MKETDDEGRAVRIVNVHPVRLYDYYFYYLLQLSCQSLAVDITIVTIRNKYT